MIRNCLDLAAVQIFAENLTKLLKCIRGNVEYFLAGSHEKLVNNDRYSRHPKQVINEARRGSRLHKFLGKHLHIFNGTSGLEQVAHLGWFVRGDQLLYTQVCTPFIGFNGFFKM